MEYFELLKSVYMAAEVPVLIADRGGDVLWSNKENCSYKKLGGLFEDKILPVQSGLYSGVRCGFSYHYNVVLCGKGAENYIVLEIISLDLLTDFLKLDSLQKIWMNYDAKVRQAIFGICSASSILHTALDEAQYFLEIDYLNIQLRDCYQILKANLPMNEIIKYSFDEFNTKAIPLDSFFKALADEMVRILGCEIELSAEAVAVKVDEDRFTYALINAVMLITESFEAAGKKPKIFFRVSEVAGDVLISIGISDNVQNKGADKIFSEPYLLNNAIEEDGLCRYVLLLFCKRFNGQFYLKDKDAVGIRLPKADSFDAVLNFRSSAVEYAENKFSPIHIAFGNLYEIKFYQ